MITPEYIKKETAELFEERLNKEALEELELIIDKRLKEESQILNSGVRVTIFLTYDIKLIYQIRGEYESLGWTVEVEAIPGSRVSIMKFSLTTKA